MIIALFNIICYRMWTPTVTRSLIFIAFFTEMNKRNGASTVGHD